jgi:DNA polymerase elongation subunit (family B)
MFYTYVEKQGGKVFHRFVDKDQKRRQEVLSEFPMELYMPGNRNDATSLNGQQLSRVEFTQVQEVNDFISNYKDVTDIYGQTSVAHQFINYKYPTDIEFNFKKFVVLNFDLEIEHDNGFPEPWPAAQEILSVSLKVFGRDQKITLGYNDFKPEREQDIYVKCKDERDLLTKFLGFWKRIAPDFITGWNIETFDVPYLVNRMTRVLGEKTTKELSPFHQDARNVIREYNVKGGGKSFRILGITTMDYMVLYQKFNPEKRESYRLDFIGETEVGEKKVDYSEYDNNLMRLYRENFEKFIVYNEKDVDLVEKIDNKLQFMMLGIKIALMTKSRYQELFGTVKIWDNLIFGMLIKDNIQIPPARYADDDGESFVGAYVKDPIAGAYYWVLSFDLTSLYPSIVRMYNMSPESIVDQAQGNLGWMMSMKTLDKSIVEGLAERNLAMAANGSTYRKDVIGILPRAMAMLFDERKRYKKLMLATKSEKEKYIADGGYNEELIHAYSDKIAMLDATQQALKIVANGGYGAIGNKAFRYFDPNIAEGITLTGQMTIRFINDRMNWFLNKKFGTDKKDYVITTDTDSMYIYLDKFVEDNKDLKTVQERVDFVDKFAKEEIEPFLAQEYLRLSEYVNATTNLMDMKREAIASRGIFRGKKNYIMDVYDNEGVRFHEPLCKMVGVESKRTSTPMICRKELEECYKVMLRESNNEILLKRIDEFRKVFDASPIHTVAFPRGVNEIHKWADGSGGYKKGTPIHVKASIIHNAIVAGDPELSKRYEHIKEGSKIKWIYLKEPNHLRTNVVGFSHELPKEFGMDNFIDWKVQFDKAFLGPVNSLAVLLGWKTERIASLEDLFG